MLSNVYVFTGNPFLVTHLRQEWVRKFRDKYGTEGISRFSLSEQGEKERLLQELSMQSFFVTKRLLVCDGNPFSAAPPKGRKKKTANEEGGISPLLAGLDAADEETIIVFTEEGSGVWPDDIPSANVRVLHAMNGTVAGYDPKRGLSYERFFSQVFGDVVGKDALLTVAKAISETTRNDQEADLFGAFHALEQLSLLPSALQTRDHAVVFLNSIAPERGFELVSTLIAGRMSAVLTMVEGLFAQGIHPRQVFRMIATQVLDLLKVKTLMQDYPVLSETSLSTKLGKASWQTGKLMTTAKKTTTAALVDLQKGLIGMNIAMHSGDLDGENEQDFLSAFASLILRSAVKKGSRESWNRSPAGLGRKAGQPSTTPA